VRNIVFENIESMVSSSLPTPKVTAKHKEDERLAAIIEHWLRNEMDRLPFETMNDMAERTVPMQGGTGWLVEWDNTKTTHCSVGETKVTLLHPKLFAPQPGVYTGIGDMDWFIIKAPTTKASVAREYGVDVFNLGEEEPELRTTDGAASRDEMLTKYIGYEKNGDGGIDRFVWVNSKVLENIQNYQARHQQVCRSCHKKRPMPGQIISNNVEPPPLLPSPGMAGSLIPEDLLGAAEPVGAPGAMTGAPAYDEELAGAFKDVCSGVKLSDYVYNRWEQAAEQEAQALRQKTQLTLQQQQAQFEAAQAFNRAQQAAFDSYHQAWW